MPESTETTEQPKKSKLQKFGPAIFWGTIIALPAINLGAAYYNYKSTQLQVGLEVLKREAKS